MSESIRSSLLPIKKLAMPSNDSRLNIAQKFSNSLTFQTPKSLSSLFSDMGLHWNPHYKSLASFLPLLLVNPDILDRIPLYI
jgi:hypothetical protein